MGAASPANFEALEAQARTLLAVFIAPATRRWRPPSSSPPACSSTWSARRCARAPTCSPISTARSCACGPTSPCRRAGCISSATRDADHAGALLLQRPGLPLSARRAPTARTRASSARPASNASATPTASRPMRARVVLDRRGAAQRGPARAASCASATSACSTRCSARSHAGALAAAAAAPFLAPRGVPRRAEAAVDHPARSAAATCRARCVEALDPSRCRTAPRAWSPSISSRPASS